MFSLAPTETFKATVKVNVATKSGNFREESFVGVFERTYEAEREQLLGMKNGELVERVLLDWEMKDESGVPVPFTPENKAALLRLSGAVRETVIAYWNHNVGAKAKN